VIQQSHKVATQMVGRMIRHAHPELRERLLMNSIFVSMETGALSRKGG